MENVIKKVTFKKSNFYTWTVLAGLETFVGFMAIYESVSMESGLFNRNEDIKNTLMLFGIFLLVSSIIPWLCTIAAGKTYLCVCGNKVYGTAGNGVKSLPFELSYADITNVWVKSSILMIETKDKFCYSLRVEERHEVCDLINSKIQSAKNQMM